jgi:hypothetical protein
MGPWATPCRVRREPGTDRRWRAGAEASDARRRNACVGPEISCAARAGSLRGCAGLRARAARLPRATAGSSRAPAPRHCRWRSRPPCSVRSRCRQARRTASSLICDRRLRIARSSSVSRIGRTAVPSACARRLIFAHDLQHRSALLDGRRVKSSSIESDWQSTADGMYVRRFVVTGVLAAGLVALLEIRARFLYTGIILISRPGLYSSGSPGAAIDSCRGVLAPWPRAGQACLIVRSP